MTTPGRSPSADLLQLIVGRWVSAAIGVAAELGVADHVATTPQSPEEIAKAVGVDASALRRLLRALASVGVFCEDAQGRYGNTPLSEPLRSGPTSLRFFAQMLSHSAVTRAWDDLSGAVRTGESAFERVNGVPLFACFNKDAQLADIFTAAMTARSAMELDAILAVFDATGVRTLVDVGGGQGLFLARVLAKNPAQKGVLFDMPEVVAHAPPVLAAAGVSSRVDIVQGDFFGTIPPGADGYVLKRILHDWNDEDALRILRQVHAAAPPGARVFVLDAVIASGNAPGFAKLLDLQMLVLTSGGRERTRPEWETLLTTTGFQLERVVETQAPIAILEARRV